MDFDQYQVTEFGKPARDRLGKWDYPYYLPNHIPANLTYSNSTIRAMMQAEGELGRLAGASQSAADFELAAGTFAILESLASSRIEGTQSTLTDVLAMEVSASEIKDADLREVFNYLAALKLGQELLDVIPLTQRLFLKIQAQLLSDVRGSGATPGELRRSPVWLGGANAGPANARYIPPLPEHLGELLGDWERHANQTPVAIIEYLALSHYQFETIHPLLDGNGRVGRILIELQLISQKALPRPALGISNYFEARRDIYYQKLQGVRERGEISEWLEFFSQAVTQSAKNSRELMLKLIELKLEYLELLGGNKDLVHALIKNPLPSVSSLMTEIGVSQPTAAKYLKKAVLVGVCESLGRSGRGQKERFLVSKVWAAMKAVQTARQ